MDRKIELQINGQQRTVRTDTRRPLLDVLREDLNLTGTKFGCGEGECGACTVLVDSVAVRSCITTVDEVAGAAIETIEGVGGGQALHPVQQAFIDQQAMQCGYCVPGQIMAAVALLRETDQPSRQQIIQTMRGNICRCCNYARILAAVQQAAGLS